MLFFDYIYYLLCKFYKLFKDERDSDSWRGSAIILISIILGLFVMTLVIIYAYLSSLSQEKSLRFFTPLMLTIYVLFLILSIIRYNKFTNYKEIYLKVEQMSKRKIWILDILSLLFILTALPGVIIAAIFLRPTF